MAVKSQMSEDCGGGRKNSDVLTLNASPPVSIFFVSLFLRFCRLVRKGRQDRFLRQEKLGRKSEGRRKGVVATCGASQTVVERRGEVE